MRKKIHSFISLIAIGALAVLAFSFIDKADAGVADNVSGFAWSENIGWISFNSTSDGSAVDYGVSVDQGGTGDFSGFAWSENIGWIDFAPTVAKYGAFPESPNHGARLEADNTVTGWAFAVAGGDFVDGWDGWIKLSGDWDGDGVTEPTDGPDGGDGGTGDDSVRLDGNNFVGYAWGSDVVGWIDFDPGVSGSGVVIDIPVPDCSDNVNNDPSQDILIDFDGGGVGAPDPGCADANDDNEDDDAPQCSDGADNDGDGLRDFDGGGVGAPDPGCTGPSDDDETDPIPDSFSLSKSGDISVNLVSGGGDSTSSQTIITVIPVGSFSEDVSLSVQSVVPAISGATYNFVDDNIIEYSEYDNGVGSSFSITVPNTLSSGVYTITIKGTGGGLERTVSVGLTVNGNIDPGYGEF